MTHPSPYTSALFLAPEHCRGLISNAWDAYNAEIEPGRRFPEWEFTVRAALLRESLPTTISNFLCGDEEENIGVLRVVGAVRPPRGTEQEPLTYDSVVELAFRGTVDIGHWITNLSVDLEPLQFGPGSARVHRGFQRAYLALRGAIQAFLDEQVTSQCEDGAESKQVLVLLSGHSLGGALALLCAYDLTCCTTACYSPCCITWGAPRVGDAEFAAACASSIPRMARFINKLDPVPVLPPNFEDPNDDSVACEALLRTKFGRMLSKPQKAFGATGFCHACPGFILDPETSRTAYLLIGSLEAATAESAGEALCAFTAPHSLENYMETFEAAIRLASSRQWRRLPSVGTWLQPRVLPEEHLFDSAATQHCTQDEFQEMVEHATTLLKDLSCSRPSLLMEFCEHLGAALDHGPELLETDEGAAFLREVQEKLLCVLPLLAATSQKANFSGQVLRQLEQSAVGRSVLEKGKDQWTSASANPEKLKEWIAALNASGTTSASFTDYCASIVDAVKGHYLDFLNDEDTRDQLSAVGVKFDEHGKIKLQQVLEKGEQLLDTPLGAKILHKAQKRALKMISSLEAVASGLVLSKQSQLYLLQLEETEQGRDLLAWGREQLTVAKEDPAYLRKLFSSVDKDTVGNLGEWCKTLLSGDPKQCSALVSSAKEHCLELLRSPAAKQLLQNIGVDVDENGQVNIAQAIEKSQQLLETPEGAEILRAIQYQCLDVLPMLETKAGDMGLKSTSTACIGKLEMSEEGRKLLDWGRSSLEEAQRDPEALRKWLSSDASAVKLAATDAGAREEFIKAVTDQFLDFLLGQLPHIEVPTIKQEKDNRTITLSNISLRKCSVKKENVHIKLMQPLTLDTGPVATDTAQQNPCNMNTNNASNSSIGAQLSEVAIQPASDESTQSEEVEKIAGVFGYPRSHPQSDTTRPENLQAKGTGDVVESASPKLSPRAHSHASSVPPSEGVVNALEEIVRVTARDIAIEIPGVKWTFQQSSFPYWTDEGSAVAHASGCCIIVTFGLQRTEVDGKPTPCFSLSSHSVVINEFTIAFKESKLSWLYNTLVRWFQQAVKGYVVASLEDGITNNIEMLLTPLNAHMQPFWPFLLRTSGLSMDMLPASDAEENSEAAFKTGLLVCIQSATGLKKLNRTGDNPWCWCTIPRKNNSKAAKKECASRVIRNTLQPEWHESHLLVPWRRGEALTFTVYDQGALSSKVHGSVNLPSNWFYPIDFEGRLELTGSSPEAGLFVQVAVRTVEEQSVTLQQQVGQLLGLDFDPFTLVVLSVHVDGLVALSCQTQGTCIQPGDFICGVDAKDSGGRCVFHMANDVKGIAYALESGLVARIVWWRPNKG